MKLRPDQLDEKHELGDSMVVVCRWIPQFQEIIKPKKIKTHRHLIKICQPQYKLSYIYNGYSDVAYNGNIVIVAVMSLSSDLASHFDLFGFKCCFFYI